MAVEFASDSPLAKTLQDTVHSKLAEAGWSTDSVEDCALAEYIVLLLVNRKSQDEVAKDVGDMVDGCDVNQASEFSRWLFEQARLLQESAQSQVPPELDPSISMANSSYQNAQQDSSIVNHDMNMDDATSNSQATSVPTGPKSMSARNGKNRTRGQRILGQVNSAMNRTSEPILHRIKGAAGAGRINTHDRQPPRGPKGLQRSFGQLQQQQQQQGSFYGAGMGLPDMQNNGMGQLTAEQQMQLLAMCEEQARMMAQIINPQQWQTLQSELMPQQPHPNQGKSLFERIDSQNVRANAQSPAKDLHAIAPAQSNGNIDPTSSMEVEQSSQPDVKQDPSNTVCKFNLTCTRPDCTFVHQSPAAPPGVTIDFSDTCSFGVACKNRKCTGKHPSPAGKGSHLSDIDCKYFPNCTNPKCPYKHPSMPPCRNGADCTVANCKFSHSKVVCKYDPCLNPVCPFKHAEGQKRGVYEDKVWINPDDDEAKAAHVSERKFVDGENAEEELVLPGKENAEPVQSAEGLVA